METSLIPLESQSIQPKNKKPCFRLKTGFYVYSMESSPVAAYSIATIFNVQSN